MMIEKADLGISFDGDGDRIGILSKDKFLVPGDLITAFLLNNYDLSDLLLMVVF